MFKRTVTALVALVVILIGMAAPAMANVTKRAEGLTISGEPTIDEASEISHQWDRIHLFFPAAAACVDPVTVVVVDRAEDAWTSGTVSGIAAFYRRSEQTVFIEHGKVRAEHLVHELAHHLDFSCGFNESGLGAEFLGAQGFAADQKWTRGSTWGRVPAEHFAEAVVGFMGIDSVDLPVSSAAFALVRRFALGSAAGNEAATAPIDASEPQG